MITNSELTKLKPKRIVYNNISYYIRFSLKNNIGSGSYPYIIQLYEQIKDPINKILNSIIIYDSSKQTVEEADISQNYKLVFTSPINTVIKKLEQVDSAAIHSPTYIQDIIEKFFEMYLEEDLKKKTKLKQEKTLQLKNYENWDGVIEL